MTTHREPYDVSIGRLEADYRDFAIFAGFENVGYRARMRGPKGFTGPQLSALTCDELAYKMDIARAGAGNAGTATVTTKTASE
jgi:hypothetical protein